MMEAEPQQNSTEVLQLDEESLASATEDANGGSLQSIGRPELVNNLEHKAKGYHSNGHKLLSTKLTGDNPSMSCGTVCQLCDPQNGADAAAQSIAIQKLRFAIGICLLFMSVEIACGLLSNSLAILTDAAHLFSDVAGFAISLFAIWAAGWKATPRHSYGFHRLEILGAFFSIQIIWLLTGILVYKAFDRLLHHSLPVNGKIMFFTASLGVLVNIGMMFILGHRHGHGHNHDHNHGHDHDEHELEECHADEHESNHACSKVYLSKSDQSFSTIQDNISDFRVNCRELSNQDDGSPSQAKHVDTSPIKSTYTAISDPANEFLSKSIKADKDLNRSNAHLVQNINIQSAYLHVFGDLIQSIGVVVAGGLIWYKPSWRIVDLGCTLLFSVLVLGTTVKILRDIIEVLMESTPRGIDTTKLEIGLREIPKVVAVHELHVWAITVGRTLLACHVRIQPDGNADAILHKVVQFCSGKFKINHVTVQIERDLDD